MIYALYFIHILISIFLILVVLLQQGKGADLSVFGGGGTQTAFGARGAATVLHKLTVTCFVLFLVTTITLGIMSSRSAPSVMQGVDAGTEEVAEPMTDGPAGGTLDDEEDDSSGSADDEGTGADEAAGEDSAGADESAAAPEGEAAESEGSS